MFACIKNVIGGGVMKIASMILGIFYSICLAIVAFTFFTVGIAIGIGQGISSANSGTVSGLPADLYIVFALISAILAVFSLVASILAIKKNKASKIMLLVSLVVCVAPIVITLATANTNAMGVIIFALPMFFGALSALFGFLSKEKQEPCCEQLNDKMDLDNNE